ncbi:conserved hypothetical protein, partial [Perkinsus marinus ATCC 50983]
MERGKRLYTIGHSNRSIENLIETLKHFGVLRVVDVRQSPYSKRFPQFCLKPLRASLEAVGIDYEHNEWLGGK